MDSTAPIHTLDSKQIRNYVYQQLAKHYKIDNLRKYIKVVSNECKERHCTLDELVKEVEKRVALSPKAALKKRGRQPKNEGDILADLFKKSVQLENPRRRVSVQRKVSVPKKEVVSKTETRGLEGSLVRNSSSSSSNKAKKQTTAQRAMKRGLEKESMTLSDLLSNIKMH